MLKTKRIACNHDTRVDKLWLLCARTYNSGPTCTLKLNKECKREICGRQIFHSLKKSLQINKRERLSAELATEIID